MEAVIVFVSILGGGLLGMIAGIAITMNKTDDEESTTKIRINCSFPEDGDRK